MTETDVLFSKPWRRAFFRWLPVMVAAMVALVGYAIYSTHTESVANARQDHQRIVDQEAQGRSQGSLISCIDGVLTDLTTGLPPVREATVARDVAVAAAFTAIRDALEHVASSAGADGSQLPNLLDALNAVQAANEHLAQVRADNPYPAPVAATCGTAE